LSPHGRDPQSSAFFSAPGTDRLYSGVTTRSPSLALTPDLKRRAGGGRSVSRS
jgi:hypothetical protein